MATKEKPERPPYGGGRDALVMAAIEVVADRGLRGLTIRSVADRAGVSHGLVRWHFGSRDGLVEATLIRSVEFAIDTSSLEPQTGAVDDMATDLADWIDAQTELAVFQWEVLLEARRKPELLPHVRGMYDDYVQAARRELERAGLGADEDLARAVFAALDGLALQQAVFGGKRNTERSVGIIHEMLKALQGRRKRKSRKRPAGASANGAKPTGSAKSARN